MSDLLLLHLPSSLSGTLFLSTLFSPQVVDDSACPRSWHLSGGVEFYLPVSLSFVSQLIHIIAGFLYKSSNWYSFPILCYDFVTTSLLSLDANKNARERIAFAVRLRCCGGIAYVMGA
jgi:hypothetical protein